MITISAFKSGPPFIKGLVRDLRVRWALEEAGLPYSTRLLDLGEQKTDAYRALQPFGQVPIFEEDGLVLFETGAIVLHIGQRSETLLPADPAAQTLATMWLISALNSIEPAVQELTSLDVFYAGQEWARLRRPEAERRAQLRLADLTARLGDRDFLDGRFTAGDLMMTTVLRIARHTDLVTGKLKTYQERCEARPAFQRAVAAHMTDFKN